MNTPRINVTPLIDVLLVLLIIFMVVTPIKPAAFKARIPAEPTNDAVTAKENPKTLLVRVSRDGSLLLNKEPAADNETLTTRLQAVFEQRIANGDVSELFADAADRPFRDRVERTVFVKAPRNVDYGTVARVVDAVVTAGAYPVSLQIDDLE